ncbi:mitochondrial inner membrane protein OXA1L isoform X2 [Strongylocentrotus purpuratus]|uniref:Membrane insertase YidC/Oxa/ALB C-terminal domain-containing protein n=1 Tax=Strongylocentrotus purpuratus TaxID=7668 RepID=A0A7M7STX2_STRPU|nr:mitochondrial inner membrane protein OXA1L isoform X2 [Strongylocentrotus purpuratus]
MAALMLNKRASLLVIARCFHRQETLARPSHIVKLYSTHSCRHSMQRLHRVVGCNTSSLVAGRRLGIVSLPDLVTGRRWNSSETGFTEPLTQIGSTAGVENLVDPAAAAETLIDPAAIGSIASTAQDILQPVGEVPFTELGLAGYTPIGFLQSGLEMLHVSAGLPWWASIVVGTLIVRACVFPLMLKNMKYTIRLNNCMPIFQKISKEMNDAKACGDQFEMTRKSMELQQFMKKNDVNPLKSFAGILLQAPIFISFFIGLRRMATLPVESMQTGGLWWFTDLTTSDPYYALPVIASLSMFLVMELGGEAGVSNAQAQKMRNVLRVMPFVVLPFIASLPKAVFCYWLTSNFFSVFQVGLLKIPAVRTAFNIPEKVTHDPKDLPKKEGFFKGLKKGFNSAQTNYDVEQTQKLHLKKLKEAGTGPVPQTFTFDPTRQQSSSSQQQAPPKQIRKKIR